MAVLKLLCPAAEARARAVQRQAWLEQAEEAAERRGEEDVAAREEPEEEWSARESELEGAARGSRDEGRLVTTGGSCSRSSRTGGD